MGWHMCCSVTALLAALRTHGTLVQAYPGASAGPDQLDREEDLGLAEKVGPGQQREDGHIGQHEAPVPVPCNAQSTTLTARSCNSSSSAGLRLRHSRDISTRTIIDIQGHLGVEVQ